MNSRNIHPITKLSLLFVILIILLAVLLLTPTLQRGITKFFLNLNQFNRIQVDWLNAAEVVGSRPKFEFQFSQKMDLDGIPAAFFLEPALDGTWDWLDDQHAIWTFTNALPEERLIHFGFRADEKEKNLQIPIRPQEWQAFIRPADLLALKKVTSGNELFLIHPGSPPAERQLTMSNGKIVDFTFSPDGEQIIYSLENAQTGVDLWQMQRDGHDASILLDCGLDRCTAADWNPRLDELVFTREKRRDTAARPTWDSPVPLLLDLTTGISARLLPNEYQFAFDPHWSSRGQWVSLWLGEQFGIDIIHAGSGVSGYRDPYSGDTGCWSADERHFYYSVLREEGLPIVSSIYQVDILSGTRKIYTGSQLYDLGFNFYHPVCQPNGQGLLVSVQVDPVISQRELWWIQPDDSYQVISNDLSQLVTHYSWNPQGNRVVFLSGSLARLGDGSRIGIWSSEAPESIEWLSDGVIQARWLP